MIKVKITSKEIDMHGHAECSVNGQDIVCASISALTCNLINSLKELSKDEISHYEMAGETYIGWESLSPKGKLLVDSWFLGLTAINEQYNCITFL